MLTITEAKIVPVRPQKTTLAHLLAEHRPLRTILSLALDAALILGAVLYLRWKLPHRGEREGSPHDTDHDADVKTD